MAVLLRPFWRYYGGKWRAAPRYPTPVHSTIIEPFAGAAGYSLRYPDRDVVLVERYAVVAAVWRYLIRVPESEIRSIPCVESVGDLPWWVSPGGRALVGFCLGSAVTSPRRTLSDGKRKLAALGRKREGWTKAHRELVASQLAAIRHWRIIEGDYTEAPDIEATWFVDPPYRGAAGAHYIHGSNAIDWKALGSWTKARRGQVIVCEASGADWLPFEDFGDAKGAMGRTSREAIWTRP